MIFTTNDAAPNPLLADAPSAGSWVPGPLLAAVLCFVLSLLMHLPWLGVTPIAGTEGHRIFPAHEMVRSHNWLVPMMFGEPFMTKPPLHHWLIALSEVALGSGKADVLAHPEARDLFAWRLPSAITGAALCAAVCLFGARWFGKTAGLVSGLCAVGMIAIWGQSQVADIDSTNTLAAVLTALCGIELFIASPKRRWPWVVGATAAMAATWMTKGPAGLTIIAAVWIWAAVAAISAERWWTLVSPAFWLPIILGAAVFFAWGFAAKVNLRHHGVAIDMRGLREATHFIFPRTFKAFFVPPFVMLPQLIAFALPISASLLFLCDRDVREKIEPSARRIAMALAAAVLISWWIAVVSGIANPLWVNPRYYYPTLLPLCPLAGAVAVAAAKSRRTADWLRFVASVAAIALAGAAVGLAVASWKVPHFHAVLVTCAVLAVIAAGWIVWRVRTSWRSAWGIVVLAMLAAVPFGAQRHDSRTVKDSGIGAAQRLEAIVGQHAPVAVGGLVTSKPETLTYANVNATFYYPFDFLPKNVPPGTGTWVILDQAEHKQWLRTPGIRLKKYPGAPENLAEKDQWLCKNGETDYYVSWYEGVVQQ